MGGGGRRSSALHRSITESNLARHPQLAQCCSFRLITVFHSFCSFCAPARPKELPHHCWHQIRFIYLLLAVAVHAVITHERFHIIYLLFYFHVRYLRKWASTVSLLALRVKNLMIPIPISRWAQWIHTFSTGIRKRACGLYVFLLQVKCECKTMAVVVARFLQVCCRSTREATVGASLWLHPIASHTHTSQRN